MMESVNDLTAGGAGILAYGLDGNFCPECGSPKMSRLMEILTGCKTCDDAITRHRCTRRPDLGDLADGEAWECPECGSRWTPRSEVRDCPDCCADCGHQVTVRLWECGEGPRVDSAPRYEPRPWTPLRDALRRAVPAVLPPPGPGRRPTGCYRMPGGAMVHVMPGCRCAR